MVVPCQISFCYPSKIRFQHFSVTFEPVLYILPCMFARSNPRIRLGGFIHIRLSSFRQKEAYLHSLQLPMCNLCDTQEVAIRTILLDQKLLAVVVRRRQPYIILSADFSVDPFGEVIAKSIISFLENEWRVQRTIRWMHSVYILFKTIPMLYNYISVLFLSSNENNCNIAGISRFTYTHLRKFCQNAQLFSSHQRASVQERFQTTKSNESTDRTQSKDTR